MHNVGQFLFHTQLGPVQILRDHFRGGGGQAKVLQLITINRGGWWCEEGHYYNGARAFVSSILDWNGKYLVKTIVV